MATTTTRSRPPSKHGGAVQVRGMIRRVWRPRYLEIDHDGVLRYYEAVDPPLYGTKDRRRRDIRNEMQAFSIPDTLTAVDGSGEIGTENVEGIEETFTNEVGVAAAATPSTDEDDHVMVEGNLFASSKTSTGSYSTETLGEWNNINIPDTVSNENVVSPRSVPDENVEVMLTPSRRDTAKRASTPTSSSGKTPYHQILDHRPKAVMTILSARLINTQSLRDVHVGLPKGTHGFVFCGRQIFSEEDAYAYSYGLNGSSSTQSVSGIDNFQIRDDICHPLSILSVNDQYFDTSRDYLCSVATEEEAKRWVAALKWAAIVANQSVERLARMGREGHRGLEGNEISIRGSFDDAPRSPIGSPTRSCARRRVLDDLTMGNDDESEMDFTRSLFNDASTVMTDPTVPDGYTIVTKVRKVNVKQTDWVRLIGIKCEIVFEIELLLLSAEHLVNRSKKRNDSDENDACWNVEQRSISRTFQEVLQLLSISLKSTRHTDLQIVLETMKKFCFGIIGLENQLAKSVECVESALRMITSDPNLCDTIAVKQFLGLTSSTEHDSIYCWDTEQTSLTLNICVGDSVDVFVKQWIFVNETKKKSIASLPLRWYGLLCLRSPIVESLLSAKLMYLTNHVLKLFTSSAYTITMRPDALLAIFGGAFYMGYNFGLKRSKCIDNITSKCFHRHSPPKTYRSPRKKATHPTPLDNDTEEEETGTFDSGSISEDSNALPSPLPMHPDNEGRSCWSRPDHKIFNVRGKTYLKDRIKVPSGPSPFKCRGVDMWLTDNPERNISRLPCVLGGKLGEEDTFIVNFLLPFGNFVMYFSINEDMPQNVANVWNKFKNGDQMYRDARLKLLPVVIEGPWIVKKAVGAGTAPALLSQSIPLQYYFTPGSGKKKGIYEVDVIITASRIAKGILNVVKSHTKKLTMALSIIIEAATEEDLPETVLCSSQLHSLNLELCPQLPKYYLEEESGEVL